MYFAPKSLEQLPDYNIKTEDSGGEVNIPCKLFYLSLFLRYFSVSTVNEMPDSSIRHCACNKKNVTFNLSEI